MFSSFALVLVLHAIFAKAEDDEIAISDNKTECARQMIDWCNNMQYPQQGVGMNIISITFEDPKGFYRVFCASDTDGTNCTRNRQPWFTCSPDHVLTYKGQILSNDSMEVDDDICSTAYKAFNEIFVQNLSYENTTVNDEVEKGMEAFFQQMAMMEEQITMIQQLLSKVPYLNNFWNDLGEAFAPGETEWVTSVPYYNNNETATDLVGEFTTDRNNQIEQE